MASTGGSSRASATGSASPPGAVDTGLLCPFSTDEEWDVNVPLSRFEFNDSLFVLDPDPKENQRSWKNLSHSGCTVRDSTYLFSLLGQVPSSKSESDARIAYHHDLEGSCRSGSGQTHRFVAFNDYKGLGVKQRLKLACQNAADESATFITNAPSEVVRSNDEDGKRDFHTNYRFISAQDAFRLSHPIHEDSGGCDLCAGFDEIVNIRQWQKEQKERRRTTRALRKKDAGGKGRMTRDTSANET